MISANIDKSTSVAFVATVFSVTRSAKLVCAAAAMALIGIVGAPAFAKPPASPSLTPYNVTWNTPSTDSRGSMPLGNGDIGMNVWVENGGDLVFYISKNDTWAGDIKGSYGLPKVGRVRVHLDPNPFVSGAPFQQTLRLQQGDIVVQGGDDAHKVNLDIWVDANHPIIHIDGFSAQPENVKVSIDTYRTAPAHSLDADVILPAHKDSVAWYNRTTNKQFPHLLGRTFGAVVTGAGMISSGDTTLQSAAAQKQLHIQIFPLTAVTDTPDAWVDQAEKLATVLSGDNADRDRNLDLAWWQGFWNRSWVIVSGNADADKVTGSYLLQRFISACASRGSFPIKFNGSIFTTDYTVTHDKQGVKTTEDVDADYRSWGGQYWFQNTRPEYWPMLQSGDFDMMQPLFRMYAAKLPEAEQQVTAYYGHSGAYFAETNPFYSDLDNIKPGEAPLFTRHYFTPILELSAMMLDYYYYTGDAGFVKATLLPIADDGAAFFEQHFQKGPDGKLLLTPDNAIETYWGVSNPTPDIAGLHYVLTRLLALPSNLTTNAERTNWTRILAETPDIPLGTNAGKAVILPFEGATLSSHRSNGENPELYSIYPFRLYGLGKPDLQMARDTFDVRQAKGTTCWLQDPIHAAYIGYADLAQKDVTTNFADSSRDPQERFPAFWGPFHDYTPDEDNGGNGMNALQLMLLQSDQGKLLLLPAWPTDWDAAFKLHAPQETIVEGTVHAGHIVSLSVTPQSRRKDVFLVQPDGTLAPFK